MTKTDDSMETDIVTDPQYACPWCSGTGRYQHRWDSKTSCCWCSGTGDKRSMPAEKKEDIPA